MKIILALAIIASTLSPSISLATQKPGGSVDDTSRQVFKEGVLFTRVSFPGNIMNDALLKIDFEKGNVAEQLKQLQNSTQNEAYAKQMQASMASMTAEEKASMGTMMMAAMMSPLYAKINFTAGKVLAKANALNYSLESFMDTKAGTGRMVAISNDESQKASIKFTADNLKKAWEKTEVDATNYNVAFPNEREKVAGYECKKAIYTLKKPSPSGGNPMQASPAYKLVVWYSDAVSSDINFLHPFYFQLDKGILKIEVHYDKSGRNKMLYEITSTKAEKLSDKDFLLTEVDPVVNYDEEPMKASLNMLAVFMSGGNK